MEYRFKAKRVERANTCRTGAPLPSLGRGSAGNCKRGAARQLTAAYEDIADQWAKLAEEIQQDSNLAQR